MKQRIERWLVISIAAFVLGNVMAGGIREPGSVSAASKVRTIKFNQKGTLLINKKEKKRLKVKIKPGQASRAVTWKSSRPKVVSVNRRGVIRGRRYGKAYIMVKAKDGSKKSARLRVQVGKKISRVSMPAKGLTLDVGKTANVKATISPSNATKKKVEYRSSDKSVATVSSSGVVRAKGKGTATITARSVDGSNKKTTCKVEVVIPTNTIKLDINGGDTRIEAGRSLTINAAVLPENASNKQIRYSSSNPNVAKVSQLGVVTGVDSGKAEIHVSAVDGRSAASLEVEVYKVELNGQKLIAHRGLSSQAPENTTAAFELAVEQGFWGIECDIRKTIDDEFVIMHDADLNRMCGYNLTLANLDLAQLKRYRISAGSNIESYPELTVPTLEEYLKIVSQSSEVHPFIELKEAFSEQELQKIVEQVESYELLERTYFISIYRSNLLTLKEMSGVQATQLQYVYGAEEDNKLIPVDDNVISWCIQNEIDLDARHTLITASDVSRLQSNGRKVNVWTVNALARAFELVNNANVDMITTEYMLNS